MRKKTIGEVLKLARVNQGMSLEDLHKKTDIQVEQLEAMEANNFDALPSSFYARSFLRKYAWAVDLDERIILDAYEDGSMIAYDEIDVDLDEHYRSRRRRKRKASFLPIFYFTVLSLAILAFVSYYVWTYINQNQLSANPSSSYSIANKSSSSKSSKKSSSSSESPSSTSSSTSSVNPLTVTGSGDNLTASLTGVTEAVNLKLTVTDSDSWVSVYGTDLESGVTLSSANPSVSTSLAPNASYTITLGIVKGVKVTVNDQEIDTSGLTNLSGNITLTINK